MPGRLRRVGLLAAGKGIMQAALTLLATAGGCDTSIGTSMWPRQPAAPESGPRSRITPFLILFDGSSGSSWFAQVLDRHPEVFIAGYEPLEWKQHEEYEGWNATAWQAAWLSHIWGGVPQTADAFPEWLTGYMRNTKLDPEIHPSLLTVRYPLRDEVMSARAVGFKLRPATISANHLAGTLSEALRALDGRVLVINRRNRVKQAISLYRRRIQGKGQFLDAAAAVDASDVKPSELEVLIRRRDEQAKSIDCAAKALGVPAMRVFYEDLLTDFNATIRNVLRYLGVNASGMDWRQHDSADSDGDGGVSGGGRAAESAGSASSEPASGSAVAGSKGFVKRTPDSLCDAVSNFEELCLHFLGSKVQVDFEPIASQQNCRCATPAAARAANISSSSYAPPAPVSSLAAAAAPAWGRQQAGEQTQTRQRQQHPSLGPSRGMGNSAEDASLFCTTNTSTATAEPTPFFEQPHLRTSGSSSRSRNGLGGADLAVAAVVGDRSRLSLTSASASGVVFGTHHKTGTVLLGQVLRVAAKAMDADAERIDGAGAPHLPLRLAGAKAAAAAEEGSASPLSLVRGNWSVCTAHMLQDRAVVCLEPHLRWSQLMSLLPMRSPQQPASAPPVRLVHCIRDPVEVCVSGYQYHLRATEEWLLQPKSELGGRSWHDFFGELSEADGVLTECMRTLPELRDQAQVYLATQGHPQVLTARLEELSTNFSGVMRSVFDFIAPSLAPRLRSSAHRARGLDSDRLVKSVGQFDLAAHPPKPTKASHVSSASEKEPLRQHLRSHPRMGRLLDSLASLMSYGQDGAQLQDRRGDASAMSVRTPGHSRGGDKSTRTLDPACVFQQVEDFVQDFWRSAEQAPRKIGRNGWHFPR